VTDEARTPLIVIPCLNEAAHIGALLAWLQDAATRLGASIVVADGGSTDGTLAILAHYAAEDERIRVVHNRKRIQAAGVNLAVREHGEGFDFLIRIDAHGRYPDDYCDRLTEEAAATGADAVVVSMETVGSGLMQAATAAAQTSKLGTGGSRHRHRNEGEWIDHGHHALMRIAAFEAVGGYDETFSHNEDAELDHRLRQAGYGIWLTGKTRMTYFPRSSLVGLHQQYVGYGRGRARNLIKHRIVPKIRQLAPLLVVPSAVLAAFGFIHWIAALPFALWIAVCIGFGISTAVRKRSPRFLLAGLSVMVIHFGWSLGFWTQVLADSSSRREAAS
jgi:succinoglycan biosynthesis protein ExoA